MCTTCAEDGVDVSSVFFDVRFSSFDATMSPLPLRGACQRASIDVIEEVELQNPQAPRVHGSRRWGLRSVEVTYDRKIVRV